MKKKLLISFSGGRTSAFMSQWLLANKADEYEMIVVFSNTGKERKETLDFIDKCDKHFSLNVVWIEPVTSPEWGVGMRHKLISYATANTTGAPFEEMIQKYGIPNVTRPFCSEYLKKWTIRSYAKSLGWKQYYTAIGIRNDEIDRMSQHKDRERLIYPLIQMKPTTKKDINDFFSKMPFDLQLKSHEGNCDFCWKKSLRKHLTIAKENPQILQWWIDMENKYGEVLSPAIKDKGYVKLPLHFFRGDVSAESLLELSKQPFKAFTDDVPVEMKQMEIDFNMDSSNGCEDSCEAF